MASQKEKRLKAVQATIQPFDAGVLLCLSVTSGVGVDFSKVEAFVPYNSNAEKPDFFLPNLLYLCKYC